MRNRKTGVLCAVKVHITREPEAIEALRREYLRIKELRHPNLLKYHELYIDTNKGKVYLVMDYFDGSNLSQIAAQNSRIKKSLLKDIALQLFGVVAYLHAQGIVHRDIKPDNILIRKVPSSDQYEVVLIDFSIAAFHKPLSTPRNGGYTMSDKTGMLAYRAPETFDQIEYTESVDMWGLGCTLYECVFGKRLTQQKDTRQSTNKKGNLLQSFATNDASIGIPVGLASLLARMLETDPTKRITISQALRHSWLHSESLSYLQPQFCGKRYSCVNILLTQACDAAASSGRLRLKSFS